MGAAAWWASSTMTNLNCSARNLSSLPGLHSVWTVPMVLPKLNVVSDETAGVTLVFKCSHIGKARCHLLSLLYLDRQLWKLPPSMRLRLL